MANEAQLANMSRTALAKAAASGVRIRKKFAEEGRLMAQRLLVGGVAGGTSFEYGMLLGDTEWGKVGGYIPGTVGDDGKGIRLDLIAGTLLTGLSVAQPKATYSDMALAGGLGMLLPALSDLGKDVGARIMG